MRGFWTPRNNTKYIYIFIGAQTVPTESGGLPSLRSPALCWGAPTPVGGAAAGAFGRRPPPQPGGLGGGSPQNKEGRLSGGSPTPHTFMHMCKIPGPWVTLLKRFYSWFLNWGGFWQSGRKLLGRFSTDFWPNLYVHERDSGSLTPTSYYNDASNDYLI